MASQAVQLIIKTHIFPNISRSKGNQSMNFAQLTEYNVRKLFFSENHAKMRQGDSFQNSFCFLKELYLM